MYPQVAQTFERHLKTQHAIFDREDTQLALKAADDKWTFRTNLDAWCRRQAFDATVARIAKDFRTHNLDQIKAVLRRAGLIYDPSKHTAYLKDSQRNTLH